MIADIEPLWPDDAYLTNVGGPMFEMRTGQRYVIANALLRVWPDLLSRSRVELSRFILDQPPGTLIPITGENIEKILARPPVPSKEKARRLMREVVEACRWRPGRLAWTMEANDTEHLDRLRRVGLGLNREILDILHYLHRQGLIEVQVNSSNTRIDLPLEGLISFEEQNERADSTMCFVAMWFDDAMSGVYENGIVPAVEAAGFVPYRVDRHEHNNRIDDEILAGIRRCSFMIADFTQGSDGSRGGVYYEAGFASGLGKQVIHTVRRDQLALVHFDTSHVNHILWSEPADLLSALSNRIGATIEARIA